MGYFFSEVTMKRKFLGLLLGAGILSLVPNLSLSQSLKPSTDTSSPLGGVEVTTSGGKQVWLPATSQPAADGAPFAAPAGSTNGTVLGVKPSGATGVICYYPSGSSMTYTWAQTQPTSAPTLTWTVTGTSYPQWPETLGPGTNLYVTARTGAVVCRYV